MPSGSACRSCTSCAAASAAARTSRTACLLYQAPLNDAGPRAAQGADRYDRRLRHRRARSRAARSRAISSARARAACRRCASATSCAITQLMEEARREAVAALDDPRDCRRPRGVRALDLGAAIRVGREWGRRFGVGGVNGITTEERRNGVQHEDSKSTKTTRRERAASNGRLLARRSAVVGSWTARSESSRGFWAAGTRAGLAPTGRRPVGPACSSPTAERGASSSDRRTPPVLFVSSSRTSLLRVEPRGLNSVASFLRCDPVTSVTSVASKSRSMRIIAGSLKGRRLTSPNWDGLRPTSDKLRETLFNVLGPSRSRRARARWLRRHGSRRHRSVEPRRFARHLRRAAIGAPSTSSPANLAHCGVKEGYAIIRVDFAGASAAAAGD